MLLIALLPEIQIKHMIDRGALFGRAATERQLHRIPVAIASYQYRTATSRGD